ncbi:hypothetical protein NDU88_000962 [Pleurodeles waltl]|uniref:Uncharacterized protein n=1 Tax=Pleurodeles waltl TaxID=8319 RepID=A0AAV7V9W2_PLEWA|nr:hypothetical protein NDU88_000962 [Pleurodeles waltl]
MKIARERASAESRPWWGTRATAGKPRDISVALTATHPLPPSASGVLFTGFQRPPPHVADALARSSEQSAVRGLPTPRVRRAASLQRAERCSGPPDPTCETRCLAPVSRALFGASRPHVSDALLRSHEQSVLSFFFFFYAIAAPRGSQHTGGAWSGLHFQLLR